MYTINDISDMNVLYKSFLKCKRDVAWKASVQQFELNLLRKLSEIQKELESGNYRLAPYYEFNINERGKQRHIRANTIKDRVTLGALNDEIILPSIQKYLIYDNGASQKGKGTSFAENRLKEHLRRFYRQHGTDGYILQIDFEKYFDNIDHEQAKKLLFQYLDCDLGIKTLIDDVIDSFCLQVDDVVLQSPIINTLSIRKGNNILRKSVAIGNPIAQSIGILYAHPIDTYCKYVKGCKFYGRYMDDIYILHHSKEFLRQLLSELEVVSAENKLRIHPKKTQIIKLSHGFTFLKKKYSLTQSGRVYVTLRRTAIQREKKRLKKLKRFMSEEELDRAYKAWRQNMVKRYDCQKKMQHTDKFYRRCARQ